jgi:hypothetical protein
VAVVQCDSKLLEEPACLLLLQSKRGPDIFPRFWGLGWWGGGSLPKESGC